MRFSFEWSQGIPWQTYSIEVQANGKSHFKGILTLRRVRTQIRWSRLHHVGQQPAGDF